MDCVPYMLAPCTCAAAPQLALAYESMKADTDGYANMNRAFNCIEIGDPAPCTVPPHPAPCPATRATCSVAPITCKPRV